MGPAVGCAGRNARGYSASVHGRPAVARAYSASAQGPLTAARPRMDALLRRMDALLPRMDAGAMSRRVFGPGGESGGRGGSFFFGTGV
jgi:hypothetical protein